MIWRWWFGLYFSRCYKWTYTAKSVSVSKKVSLFKIHNVENACLASRKRSTQKIREEDFDQSWRLSSKIVVKAIFWQRIKLIVWVIFDLTDINGVFVHFLGQRSLWWCLDITMLTAKLDVTNHNKDYTSVEQCEISIARKPVVAWRCFRVKLRQKYAVA